MRTFIQRAALAAIFALSLSSCANMGWMAGVGSYSGSSTSGGQGGSDGGSWEADGDHSGSFVFVGVTGSFGAPAERERDQAPASAGE